MSSLNPAENMGSKIKELGSKYFIPILIIIYIIIILIKITRDKEALTKKYAIYSVLIVFPILLLGLFVNDAFSQTDMETKQIIMAVFAMFSIISLYFYYIQTSKETTQTINYIMFVIFFILILTTLSIVYVIFFQYIKNVNGFAGFIIQLIFILPCYFMDFLRFIIADVKSTPPMMLILFVIEIVFLLLYHYVPKWITMYSKADSSLLTEKTIESKDEYILVDDASKFYAIDPLIDKGERKLTDMNGNISSAYNTNYSISLWLYLNQENAQQEKKNILYYGESAEKGKPQISYRNAGKYKDEVVITVGDSNKTEIRLNVPSQKWNYLVVSYKDSKVDVWLNGHLEHTVMLSGTLPVYSNKDKIVIGEKNGKYSFIKNVKYIGGRVKSEEEIVREMNIENINQTSPFGEGW